MSASASWVFRSGRPLVLEAYEEKDIPFSNILKGNILNAQSERLPAYHRLDVGINAQFSDNTFQHKIQLGVYNAYNRKNILFAKPVDATRANGVFGLSVLPSLSYSIAW